MAERMCACGTALSEEARFCPACGSAAPVGDAPAAETAPVSSSPAAPPAAAAVSTPTPVDTLLNWARGAKTLALLFFLLPWVTVSCSGQPLVSMSGLNLATGSVSMRNPMTGAAQAQSGSPELLVLLAALAILAGLALTFIAARRMAGTAALAGSAAAIVLLLVEVFVILPGRLRAAAAEQQGANPFETPYGRGGRNPLDASVADMLSIDTAIGFWLTVAALVGAAFLGYRIRNRAKDAKAASEQTGLDSA